MDFVPGQLLIYRLKENPRLLKAELTQWLLMLCSQLEQYQKSNRGQCYKYLNPYSVMAAKNGQLLLLDLAAASNDFVFKNMQKRAMREHFVKPIVHIQENMKSAADLYAFGKTMQFILSYAKVEPQLTRMDIFRLNKVIDGCLDENAKKKYESMSQARRDLAKLQNRS